MNQRRYDAVVQQQVADLAAGVSLDACLVSARAALRELAGYVDAQQLRWPAGAETYARHLLARCPTTQVSLFAVVWRRGQISAVHDHGTWGVVTVVAGTLFEESWTLGAAPPLTSRPPVSLTRGQVASFSNAPTYVHRVTARTDALSLHLYGDRVASYHVFDPATGARTCVDAQPADPPGQS